MFSVSDAVKKAFRNASWMTLERLSLMLISLLLWIFIARKFGPEFYGLYSYLISIVTLSLPLMHMGMTEIITKDIASNRSTEAETVGAGIFIRFVGCVTAAGLVYLFSRFYLDLEQDLLRLIVLLSTFYVFWSFETVTYWFRAKLISRYVNIIRITAFLISSIIKVVAIYKGYGIDELIYISVIEIAITPFIQFLLYLHISGHFSKLTVHWETVCDLLKRALWVMFADLAGLVYLKVDQIMLGSMVDHKAVGIYAVAARLSEVWYFFPAALVSSFISMLVTARNSGSQVYEKKLQALYDLLMLLAVVLILTITFSSDILIDLCFGPKFAQSAPVLVVHIWASLFIFMHALTKNWLLIESFQKYMFYLNLVGAVANIAINIALIPLYGPMGAAVATLISYSAASYFGLFLFKRTRPVAVYMTRTLFFPLRLKEYLRRL